jgi:hypothetical protein
MERDRRWREYAQLRKGIKTGQLRSRRQWQRDCLTARLSDCLSVGGSRGKRVPFQERGDDRTGKGGQSAEEQQDTGRRREMRNVTIVEL